MKIVGVDPGTWHTGVGIIDVRGSQYSLCHVEVIHVPKKMQLCGRLRHIYRALSDILDRVSPEVMSLENVFFCRDVQALVKIGEARACAMLAASEKEIPVVEYPPARVKQAVAGNGRATKDQIRHMVRRLLNLRDMPCEDGADALAAAICHVHAKNVPDLTAVREMQKKREALRVRVS